ncbi:hypothetical protein B0H14DRAFT_2618731 [Mycena olivaceomarginata]|nr:hypothetical protein B0H14DRAFT_2618731 [Mycena olivaceomarginata]
MFSGYRCTAPSHEIWNTRTGRGGSFYHQFLLSVRLLPSGYCGSGRRGGKGTGGCLLVVGWAVGRHLGRVRAVETQSILFRHVHGRSPCGVRKPIRCILPHLVIGAEFEPKTHNVFSLLSSRFSLHTGTTPTASRRKRQISQQNTQRSTRELP